MEHNKGCKIYPQNQVILDCIMSSIPLKHKCLSIILIWIIVSRSSGKKKSKKKNPTFLFGKIRHGIGNGAEISPLEMGRKSQFGSHICEQQRLWQVCTFAQARRSIRHSTRISYTGSNGDLCSIYVSSEGLSESAPATKAKVINRQKCSQRVGIKIANKTIASLPRKKKLVILFQMLFHGNMIIAVLRPVFNLEGATGPLAPFFIKWPQLVELKWAIFYIM